MEPFVIRRAVLLARAKEPALLALYDAALQTARETPPERRRSHEPIASENGDLTWPEGWQEANTRHLLDTSPRAFWLMARARLIPLSEMEAISMIDREGKALDRFPVPVANVIRFDGTNSKSLMLIRAASRARHRNVARAPEPVKVVSIDDDEESEKPDIRKKFGGK